MSPRPRTLLAGAAACAVAFLVLLALAYESAWGRWVDSAALQGFLGFQGPTASPLADHVASLGNVLQVGLIGFGLALLALARGRPRSAAFVIALLALTSVSSQLLKALLVYPRADPSLGPVLVEPEAFPSGHATASMALAIALVVVVPRMLRKEAALLGAAFTVSVSFAIVALSWHYPSDVLGGYLLAVGWALVLLAGMRAAETRFPERHLRNRLAARIRPVADGAAAVGVVGVLGAVAVTLAVVGGAVLAVRLPEILDYARANTTFVGVAGAVSVSALVMLAALARTLPRRG